MARAAADGAAGMSRDPRTLPLPLEPVPDNGDGHLWLTAQDLAQLAAVA